MTPPARTSGWSSSRHKVPTCRRTRARMSNSRRSGRGFRVSGEFVANNPGADPTATELVINLLVTATLLQGQLDGILREYRLTMGSFNVLQVIAGDPQPLSPSDIAA